MRCPADGAELQPYDRSGIEVDRCPQCRGIWLDHGELEKLLDRQEAYVDRRIEAVGVPRERFYDDDDHDRDYRRYQPPTGYHRKKKKGFLSEMLDFD